ncbi:unnamed protein product [Lactuca saligna]|uniref:Uncharacterized protein n=1 Tax=Lactuca saligna TaxID=75948 RepID=A0AA35VG87_LACSI|nr:unnamed protein product [Lactuca saligna]
MVGMQQDDPYYQALVVYGEIEVGLDDNPEENPEGGPAMGQEVGPGVEPKEYVVTDYEYDEFDWESDEGKDAKETPSKPQPSETLLDPHTIQESDTNYIHTLEKEIANFNRQLFAAESRAVRAEQREEVITQEHEMSFHRNNKHTREAPLLQIDLTTFQVAVTAAVTAVMAQLNASNTNRGGNSVDNTSRSNNQCYTPNQTAETSEGSRDSN